jgi:hypothetical protein
MAGTFACVRSRVLVAWDGTREANRALHDALPLIGDAEAVTVLYVETRDSDLDRVRPRLERVIRPSPGRRQMASRWCVTNTSSENEGVELYER